MSMTKALCYSKKVGGGKDIIEYASWKVFPSGQKYGAAEKEVLAVVGLLENSKIIWKVVNAIYTQTTHPYTG